MDTKACSRCKEVKLITQFPVRNDTPSGRSYICRLCRNAVASKHRKTNFVSIRNKDRQRYKTDPKRNRGKDLKRNFNICIEEYDELFQAQSGLCLICNEPETAMFKGKLKALAVDHCHSSKNIR